MTLIFAEGDLMSDPIPKDGGTEARDSDESLPERLPPSDLPEELIRRRLARLDLRRPRRLLAGEAGGPLRLPHHRGPAPRGPERRRRAKRRGPHLPHRSLAG